MLPRPWSARALLQSSFTSLQHEHVTIFIGFRQDDDQRSSRYDDLLAAETRYGVLFLILKLKIYQCQEKPQRVAQHQGICSQPGDRSHKQSTCGSIFAWIPEIRKSSRRCWVCGCRISITCLHPSRLVHHFCRACRYGCNVAMEFISKVSIALEPGGVVPQMSLTLKKLYYLLNRCVCR